MRVHSAWRPVPEDGATGQAGRGEPEAAGLGCIAIWLQSCGLWRVSCCSEGKRHPSARQQGKWELLSKPRVLEFPIINIPEEHSKDLGLQ